MCELFAMSSRSPSCVRYSLDEFSKHGGERYSNRDGWGIVFYEDKDAHIFKEPAAAADSELARMVACRDTPTTIMMAHVRLATSGEPALKNTHPFRRVVNGRAHHFAHNGDLHGLRDDASQQGRLRRCIGDTDSELAFIDLLSHLESAGGCAKQGLAPLANRFEVFANFARDMTQYGSANFLYSDGDALFVHAHRRRYEQEDGTLSDTARPPGLHIRHCAKANDSGSWRTDGAEIATLDPQTVLVASVPLNDSGWEELPECCALVLKDGEVVLRRETA